MTYRCAQLPLEVPVIDELCVECSLKTHILQLTAISPVCAHTGNELVLLLYKEILGLCPVPVERECKTVLKEHGVKTYVETGCTLPFYTVILNITELQTHILVIVLH